MYCSYCKAFLVCFSISSYGVYRNGTALNFHEPSVWELTIHSAGDAKKGSKYFLTALCMVWRMPSKIVNIRLTDPSTAGGLSTYNPGPAQSTVHWPRDSWVTGQDSGNTTLPTVLTLPFRDALSCVSVGHWHLCGIGSNKRLARLH